jgi:hypothetical protein
MLMAIAVAIKAVIAQFINWIIDTAIKFLNNLSLMAQNIWNWLKDVKKAIWTPLAKLFTKGPPDPNKKSLMSKAGDLWKKAVKFIMDKVNAIIKAIESGIKTLIAILENAQKVLAQCIKDIRDAITDWIKSARCYTMIQTAAMR